MSGPLKGGGLTHTVVTVFVGCKYCRSKAQIFLTGDIQWDNIQPEISQFRKGTVKFR